MCDVLTVEDVGVERGGVRVLDGVSAQFLPGRCTAVAGPNGAGKSTLLRLLDRLEEPTSGRVLLQGRPLPLRWPGALHRASSDAGSLDAWVQRAAGLMAALAVLVRFELF
jgi:ABC-type cobalamin/Fe3+-siderophores transport system ATPase subunit